MKVIIAGTRSFNDYELLKKEVMDRYLKEVALGNIAIVSGGANGADRLGEQLAKEVGLKLVVFPAEWDKYGKSAGPIRNKEMAMYANEAIVFWDGKSRGTMNMIQTMREIGKPVYVITYSENDKE